MADDTSVNEDRQNIAHPENGTMSDVTQDDAITADEATDIAGVGLFQVKLVILSGFVWMARGFETVILRNMGPLLTCNWNLRRSHEALLITITAISTILGCFLYGVWSDRYGRRTALSSSLIFLFVFGAVSAGLPNYTWFVIFRSIAGFALGGLPQSLVLCCEYMPAKQRGRAVFILSCFWALGVVIMFFVLYSTVETEANWRIFVAVGALPAFLAMILMRFFPESFRFLMVTNQYFVANEIMAGMAEANKKNITAQLQRLPPHRSESLVLDLLGGTFLRSTILFWIMGFVTSISFLGLTIITPRLLLNGTNRFQSIEVTTDNFMGSLHEPLSCMKSMSAEEFVFIMWTTALDFPGFVVYMILVDFINRKPLLCASYILSTMFIFLLFIPSKNMIYNTVFVYSARTLLHGQFDLVLLMVAEAFPTSHRGTAMGMEVAIFYIGAFLSTYIVQGLLEYSLMHPIITYGVFCFGCAIASIFLQRETRGEPLEDIITVSQVPQSEEKRHPEATSSE